MKRLVIAIVLVCCACAAPTKRTSYTIKDWRTDPYARELVIELNICLIEWIGENDDLRSDARTVAEAAAGACKIITRRIVRYIASGAPESVLAKRTANLPHKRDVDRAVPFVFEFRRELDKEISRLRRQERMAERQRQPNQPPSRSTPDPAPAPRPAPEPEIPGFDI